MPHIEAWLPAGDKVQALRAHSIEQAGKSTRMADGSPFGKLEAKQRGISNFPELKAEINYTNIKSRSTTSEPEVVSTTCEN